MMEFYKPENKRIFLKTNMTQKIQKITASEAAKILNISKTRVLQLINLNIIPAERVGKQFVLRKPDVLAARGRKAGRPRKQTVQTAHATQPISPQEAMMQDLQELISNRAQANRQNAESVISQIKPNTPTAPISYQTVPRPSVTKTNTNRRGFDMGGLDLDD
jgi:excisionase family DNA binding protein